MTSQTTTSAVLGADASRPDQPRLRRDAAVDLLAVAPGVVPFGVTLGMTAAGLGTGAVATIVGGAFVYGGSAQLTTMTVLHLGAGLAAAVASGLVVIARVMLYGAALEPVFRHQPSWFRLLAPAFIVDQTYVSASARRDYNAAEFRCYWAWLGYGLLAIWVTSLAAGLLVGPVLPPLPHLALVGTALFVAMLVPRLADSASIVGAVTAAVVALGAVRLVPTLGILGGACAGVVAAVLTGRSRS
jgi:predicted branched-subunit amino acid permease